MNAPAKVSAKKADEAPANTALWDSLGKTDPKHTKPFKRAGGFSGTALKPQWAIRRLTEEFGPCGKGWAPEEPQFQVVPGHNGEVLVYCTVSAWYMDGAQKCFVHGVGGDKIVSHIKANAQYNRPERWENDDEAFKKAFTDALMNAFKFIGVGADIHMGQFDDSKYVAALAREFEAEASNGEQTAHSKPTRGLDGPITSKAELYKAFTALQTDVARCGDNETLDALMATEETKAVVEQCERDAPHYLHGGDPAPPEFEGLFDRIKRMRDEFQLENIA